MDRLKVCKAAQLLITSIDRTSDIYELAYLCIEWLSGKYFTLNIIEGEDAKKALKSLGLIIDRYNSLINGIDEKDYSEEPIDDSSHDSAQYSKGYIDGLMNAKKKIVAAIKEDFDIEYWLDDAMRTIEETVPDQPIDPREPPDNCDYEIGYDPYLGSFTDDC